MHGVTYHILGSGNALDPANLIFHARLNALDHASPPDKAIIYGRKQLGMENSEAASGVYYLRRRLKGGCRTLIPDDLPKSTSETMAIIAQALHEDYQHKRSGAPPMGHIPEKLVGSHVVVTNWPYMARTRYLLRCQWQRLYPHLPWENVEPMVEFRRAGGTFKPQYQAHGWRAAPRWLWSVGIREILSWGKAIYDPFDTKLNQKRESAKIF